MTFSSGGSARARAIDTRGKKNVSSSVCSVSAGSENERERTNADSRPGRKRTARAIVLTEGRNKYLKVRRRELGVNKGSASEIGARTLAGGESERDSFRMGIARRYGAPLPSENRADHTGDLFA